MISLLVISYLVIIIRFGSMAIVRQRVYTEISGIGNETYFLCSRVYLVVVTFNCQCAHSEFSFMNHKF